MTDKRIIDLINEAKRPVLSYEFFPPRTDKGVEILSHTINALEKTKPDFVTITYGAGGSTREKTMQVAKILQTKNMGPVMPHLTCVGSSQAELRDIAQEFYDQGFRNIMTLRGDAPEGEESFVAPEDGLSCARDLVKLLKEQSLEFCNAVAGYPETHPEAQSAEIEMAYLKEKQDAGADFITTQLFFDNQLYFGFVEKCRAAGITIPIIPGIMPAMSLKQISRITGLCGSSFPDELAAQMESASGEGEAAEKVGLKWFTAQLKDLLSHDIPGVHLYILNKSSALDDSEFAAALASIRG